MTRSQPVFALPALALSLIAAGLFTACGSKPAAEVAAAPPAVLPAAENRSHPSERREARAALA